MGIEVDVVFMKSRFYLIKNLNKFIPFDPEIIYAITFQYPVDTDIVNDFTSELFMIVKKRGGGTT